MYTNLISKRLLCVALLLASCGTSRIGNGNLQVELTDAPAPYEAVNVTLSAVEVHYLGESDGSGSARWLTVVTKPGTFDLLSLQNGTTAVLGKSALPAGDYDQLRLVLTSAEVVTGGTAMPMTMPSGAEMGLKMNYKFKVVEDEDYVVVLDFDAAQSVKQNSNGEYMMMPVVGVMHFNHMQAGNGHADMSGNMPNDMPGNLNKSSRQTNPVTLYEEN